MSTIVTCGPTGDYPTITTALQAISTAIGSTIAGKGEFRVILEKEHTFDEVVKFPQIFGQLYTQQMWAGDWKSDAGFSANDKLTIMGDQEYYSYEQERPKIIRSEIIESDLVGSRPFWPDFGYDKDISSIIYWPPAFSSFINLDVGVTSMGAWGLKSMNLFRLNDKAMTLKRVRMDISLSLESVLYYVADGRLRGTDDITVDNNYHQIVAIFRGVKNGFIQYLSYTNKPRRIYGLSCYNIDYGIMGSPSPSSLTIRNAISYNAVPYSNVAWQNATVSHSITNQETSGNVNGSHTYYQKTLGEMGWVDPVNGDLNITRSGLSFGKGIMLPESYTHDFVGKEIVFPSMGVYYMFDIPNASAPKPSHAEGVYGNYASGCVLAYPCDGRASLLGESKRLISGAGHSVWNSQAKLVPSMYGWVLDTQGFGPGFRRGEFRKLEGKKTATLICHTKGLATQSNYIMFGCVNTWSYPVEYPNGVPANALCIRMLTNGQKIIGHVGDCMIEGTYSGLFDFYKWNTYIMRINLAASTNDEKVQLFIGHRGLTRKIAVTFTGTLPSTISNISTIDMGRMPALYANFVIYDRFLTNNEIYNICYDPFIMYKSNIKRKMFVFLEVIKSQTYKWFHQAGQQLGQMFGQGIKK